MHALYFYWIFPPDDYLRARSGVSTFFKCNEFQFLQAHTCAPQNGCKRLLVVLQFFLPMIIGTISYYSRSQSSFFSILEGGLHARNLRIFCIPSLSHFSRFFSTKNCGLRAESLAVGGGRQFKDASDLGFCKHANAGRSLIKSSRQISSGGISNISPISAFETIHSPSDISVLS